MGTVLVVLVGLALWFVSASVISIVFSLVTGTFYVLGKRVAWMATPLAAIVAAGLGLTWSAILFLTAERLVTGYHTIAWLTWGMAIVAAALPISKAVESARLHAKGARLTADQGRLWTALGAASWLQASGMAIMFFVDAALDWWRWLPI